MTPKNWTFARLDNFIKTNFESYSEREKWKYIHYLDTGNITDNCINEISKLVVGTDAIPSRAKRKVKDGDVVFSTVRPNQRHFGIIKSPPPNFLVSTGFTTIRANEETISAEFIFWYLSQPNIVEYLQGIGETSTSAYPAIKPSDIENLQLFFPPLSEQKAIASVLGALDDKIENNRRMNETLEEMARAIFKSWFVDFDPVHAKAAGNAPAHMDADTSALFPSTFGDDGLPVGWKTSSLVSFCESVRDGTHNSPKSTEIGEYLITTRHIVDGEIDLSNAYKISKEDYDEVNRRSKVDQWDVLISMIGTVGEVCLVRDDPVFAIKNMGLFKNTSRIHSEWLYRFLKSNPAQKHLLASLRGTTQLYIPLGELRKFPCVCPPDDILNSFGKIACTLSDHIGHNLSENKTLAELRDTLLPKLMSGEIRVADAERKVEAAL